jgi:predicted amidohydrolase YtcJ
MKGRVSADLAIVNCRIRTLDPSRPAAAAVAIADGLILAVGDTAEIGELFDAKTEVIDGAGRALVPGLVDSHQHGVSASDVARGADLTGAKDLKEIQRRLARERERVGDGAWVLGWGADYASLGHGDLSFELLEEAVKGQPALVRTVDVHTGLASRRALELANVTAPVDLGDGSVVVCHEGVPTGELREHSAIQLVARAVPKATGDEARAAAAEALRKAASFGITAVHQMDGATEKFEILRDLEERGDLDVRVIIPVWQHPESGENETLANFDLAMRKGRLWRGGVVKFFLDGVVDTGTAWLCEPDTNGLGRDAFWPDLDRYGEAVRRYSAAGLQCATHAIGDAAVRCALDAYRAAPAVPGVMHRVEHIELLQDEDVRRFAQQGVAASFQPIHMQWLEADGLDRWSSAVGPHRARRAFRWGELVRSGAVVAFGSDWPVADRDPRLGMAWARLRRPPRSDRAPWLPEQVITGLQALACYTIGPARATGEESVAGRIAPTYRADLAGFAEDPVDCHADDLPDLPVWLTVVDGRVVWRDRNRS